MKSWFSVREDVIKKGVSRCSVCWRRESIYLGLLFSQISPEAGKSENLLLTMSTGKLGPSLYYFHILHFLNSSCFRPVSSLNVFLSVLLDCVGVYVATLYTLYRLIQEKIPIRLVLRHDGKTFQVCWNRANAKSLKTRNSYFEIPFRQTLFSFTAKEKLDCYSWFKITIRSDITTIGNSFFCFHYE